jgi:excisionase family DNA binding protein
MAQQEQKWDPDDLRSEENIMTLVEVARYLHVHPSTVYRLVRGNQLQGFKVGRDWRFKVEEIDTLQRTQRSLEGSYLNTSAGGEASIGTKVDDSLQITSPGFRLQCEAGARAKGSGEAPEDPSARLSGLPNRNAHSGERELNRLRQLEEENGRLRRIVADQALDIQVLKETLAKEISGVRLRTRTRAE